MSEIFGGSRGIVIGMVHFRPLHAIMFRAVSETARLGWTGRGLFYARPANPSRPSETGWPPSPLSTQYTDNIFHRYGGPMRIVRFASLLLILCILGQSVLAESVAIAFANCKFLRRSAGATDSLPESSPYTLSNIVLGGTCGTAEARYERGEVNNNTLLKGMTCRVSARLKKSGRAAKNARLWIEKENGQTRTSGYSNATGRVTLSYKVTADGPPSYRLVGPRIPGTTGRLGCFIYAYSSHSDV